MNKYSILKLNTGIRKTINFKNKKIPVDIAETLRFVVFLGNIRRLNHMPEIK